jgi:transglutaminase-like putative cysteine protease
MTHLLLARMSGKLWTRIDGLMFLRIALLCLALVCLVRGLFDVVQGLLFIWVISTAWLGILVGWLLVRANLPAWKAGIIAVVIGAIWLVLAVGRIVIPLQGMLTSLFHLANQTFRQLVGFVFQHQTAVLHPDLGPLFKAGNGLTLGLIALSTRLSAWVRGTLSGMIIIDPVVTNLLWCSEIWLASTWAAWFIRLKGAAFLGLLPVTALLASTYYYVNSTRGIIWLVCLGGCILLLQGVEGYHFARNRWQASHMDRIELEPALATTVLSICIILMLTGFLSPSLSIQDLSRAVQNLVEARQNRGLAESLGLEQTPSKGEGISGLSAASISSRHPIGAGPQLSDEVMFYVSIERYDTSLNDVSSETHGQTVSIPFYWRSQTFDYYTGHGWAAITASQADFEANQLFIGLPLSENHLILRQRVQRIGTSDNNVYVSGELVSVDQPYSAIWRDSGDLIGAQTEATVYRAESHLPFISVSQLRTAGTDYPVSIRDRYLQLPDTLPQRVSNLALDLTATLLTPYDQEMAIQSYLHTFPYTLDVPAPPSSRDAVDFFLFDLKKGYCDYYASAMVVLSRAAGVPARLVTGYTRGFFDTGRGQFTVTAANAHSWVEIYFPSYGWVEFEPTGGQSATVRSEGKEWPQVSASTGRETGEDDSTIFSGEWVHYLAPGLGGTIACLLILFLFPFESWILLLVPSNHAVTTIYRRLYHQGTGFHINRNASRTPLEFTSVFKTHLGYQIREKRSGLVIASLFTDLDWLTDLYSRLLYSPRPPSPREHRQAVWVWYRLRRRLTWVRLKEVLLPLKHRE